MKLVAGGLASALLCVFFGFLIFASPSWQDQAWGKIIMMSGAGLASLALLAAFSDLARKLLTVVLVAFWLAIAAMWLVHVIASSSASRGL